MGSVDLPVGVPGRRQLSGWWSESTCCQGARMEADFRPVLYPVDFWTCTWVSGTLSPASDPG